MINFKGYTADLLYLTVIRYNDKTDYDSNYAKDVKPFDGFDIRTKNLNIDGNNVKFINTTILDDNTVIESYFFSKNGKYYSAQFTDYSVSKGYQSVFGDKINSAISSVINSVN